ncbi:MAG: hypothetical protein HGA31_04780 [Candidatus Moranbacteria bacterium]|nr:hypothetical protein [Candidatus Moranbacteria bacterium]
MGTTGLFTCIAMAIVFVYLTKELAFSDGRFSMEGFLKACLSIAFPYLIFAGVWNHGNELKKEVFLDQEYLTLRNEFRSAGSHVTNGGKIDSGGGTLDKIVKQRKELIRRRFPFVKGDIRWWVFYDHDTLDKKVYFNEDDVKVPFGWRMPPFPWQLRSYVEYDPYSSER